MAKEEAFQLQGKVMQALANTQFRVKLDNGHEIICHIAGKMRNTSSAFCPETSSPWRSRRTIPPRDESPSAGRCVKPPRKQPRRPKSKLNLFSSFSR